MKIAILTSSRKGTASYCLPVLLENTDATVVQVIYCESAPKKKSAFYRRKLKKIAAIGILGALNGIRMRKWYDIDRVDGQEIGDIEEICQKNRIPFAVTTGINSDETIRALRSGAPDLGLSLGNSYIAPKVFTIPVYGMLNIHGEVLPRFQNAQSVIWQLYEGNTTTGYTIHQVSKKIDAGEIFLQEEFPILFKGSLGETVHATSTEILRRAALGLSGVVNFFDRYNSGKRVQGAGTSYTTPSFRQFLKIAANFRRLKNTNRQNEL
jgi:methionyl-tRNA formyltransferase